MKLNQLQHVITRNVEFALKEDVGSGDVSATLIDVRSQSTAELISRSSAVFCGKLWVDEVAQQIGDFSLSWHVDDGDLIKAGQSLATIRGSSRSILTAERVMLNFAQLLSGTATKARAYCDLIQNTQAILLDTRKTLPGLRIAQKYAVSIGGGQNHRIGLFDAILIKENHIEAAGSIQDAVHEARDKHPELRLEVEVETLEQLSECVDLGVRRVLLDNFSTEALRKAVARYNGTIELEASGGVTTRNIREIAETGVDYISVGAITKDVEAIDLSLQFVGTNVQ